MSIRFHTGVTYNYHGVPPEAHQALMAAPSIGRYLAANVAGNFKVTKEAKSK